MTTVKPRRILWYTRREGVVRGPYPEKQISRYILLGRIRDSDQLKPDDGEWAPVSSYPELIPEVMKLPPTEENYQKLLIARMREDERQPGDRRDRIPDPPAHIKERRNGADRRRAEADTLLRHRELRYQVSHATTASGKLYRYPLMFGVAVVLGFLASYILEQAAPVPSLPDCGATPRPGVNWNNCNLTGLRAEQADLIGAKISNGKLDAALLVSAQLAGAVLEYTSLNLSNLRRADLSHANLTGVTLRGADLRDASFVQANLSYANLSGAQVEGADFSGAVLDRAIWVDMTPCAAGSVGVCKRRKANN